MWKLKAHSGFDYEPLQEERDTGSRKEQDTNTPLRASESWLYSYRTVVVCIILLTNFFTASALYLLSGHKLNSTVIGCAGDVQPATPWMSEVDRGLHTYTFPSWDDGPTRYSEDTAEFGDEVDDAWKDLGVYYKLIVLPIQYAEVYNISAEKHFFVTPEDNQDTLYSGFPVNIEAFHYLHCINLLRQGLYYNYDFYRSRPSYLFSDGPERDIRKHLAHCVDALRELVMCWSDSDVLPILRPIVLGEKPHITDFTRRKRCRNFESLRMWAEERQWAGARDPSPKHGN